MKIFTDILRPRSSAAGLYAGAAIFAVIGGAIGLDGNSHILGAVASALGFALAWGGAESHDTKAATKAV